MVDSGVRLLRLMPKMAPVYSGRIRRLVLRNPRYGLFYVLEYRGVVIHAVCDLRRDRESLIEHLRG